MFSHPYIKRSFTALMAALFLAGSAGVRAEQKNWFFKLFSLKSDYIVPSVENQLKHSNNRTITSHAGRTTNQLKHAVCAAVCATGTILLSKYVLPSIQSSTMRITLQSGIAALSYLTCAAIIRGVGAMFVKDQNEFLKNGKIIETVDLDSINDNDPSSTTSFKNEGFKDLEVVD